jgi:anti-anti-sigma factor
LVAPEEPAPGPMRALRPLPKSRELVVELAGPIDRADIPALCEGLGRTLQERPVDLVVCDVGGLRDADCVAVDALARLQLTARRSGCRVRLRGVSSELEALLRLVGLREILCPGEASGVETRRQPE